MRNESLKKQNFSYQETKDLFQNERSRAKKHLHYSKLRLQFLDWLERGWMDEQLYKVETEKYDQNSMEELVAWQEAVLMFADELREDEFYVDIVGNVNNFSVTWGYGNPETDEEKAEARKIISELKKEFFSESIEYSERKKLDNFFHSLMNMKTKEDVIFHNRYDEFKKMVKENARKGDTYQDIVSKISKPSKKLKNKSPLDVFLTRKSKKTR